MIRAIYNGHVLAQSNRVKLAQGINYFPPESVNLAYIKPAKYITPDEKGTVRYFDLIIDGQVFKESAWQYFETKENYSELLDCYAFYGAVTISNSREESSSKSKEDKKENKTISKLLKYWRPIIPELTIKGLIVIFVFVAGNIMFQYAALDDYSTNVYTELLGIIATLFVWQTIAKHREDTNQIILRQAALRLDAGSNSSSLAKRAIDVLRQEGWLASPNGILKGAELRDTDWSGINASYANLERIKLDRAVMQKTNLIHANLYRAHLWKVDMQGALLKHADLRGTFLDDANLQNCDLSYADLRGANLWGTNLTESVLDGVKLDEHTRLPDDSLWSKKTDMQIFTDMDHPNFFDTSSIPRKVKIIDVTYT